MNPYKLIERIGNITVYVIVGLAVAFGLYVLALASAAAWGWWALLLIPGVPVGLLAIALIGCLGSAAADAIGREWRKAKYRWEAEHPRPRKTVPTSELIPRNGRFSTDKKEG